MGQLSGGWRMKVQLAKALWLRPRLLLLDEPTNHLDFRALCWLQEKLEAYPHTTVVVSHDVSFLHSACTEILWMNEQKLESLPREMVSQDDIVRMQRRRPLSFSFSTPKADDAENHGFSLHGVEFSYGSKENSGSRNRCQPLLRVNDDVRFSGQSRAVLLGKNGCGKSTFLDICCGKLKPTRGIVDRTPELKIGHYSQLTDHLDHSNDTAAAYLVRECRAELAGHAGATHTTRLREARALRARQAQVSEPCTGDAVAAMRERAVKDRTASAAAQEKKLTEIARSVLTHFGFEGDVAVTVPVSRLSGGQKACLKFAVLSLRPVHILLLDEPTNHLDAEACEALARGLAAFKGGIIAVTHDELLIYRLIQCNWSTSELLSCQSGVLRKEKQFGANCLNALKDELRRAEEPEAKIDKLPRKKKEVASRQPSGARMPAVPHPTPGIVTVTTVVRSGAPSWMQMNCRRPNRRRPDGTSKDDQENIPSNIAQERETALRSQATPSCSMHAAAFDNTSRAKQADHSPQRQRASVGTAWQKRAADQQTVACAVDEKIVPPAGDAPESWEDRDHSDAPESWEDLDSCDVVSTEAPEPNAQPEPEPETRGSGHSRLRTDLINLNKAVAKWLKQESLGEISCSCVEQRIGSSVAARHLRERHGAMFREADFVRDVIAQAQARTTRCQQ
jgi:ATPase subunit of ABC transporter with duplicated ATPase domains